METYYVYTHTRLDTNQVFYVGLGKVLERYKNVKSKYNYYKRAYTNQYRNQYWKNIVNKAKYEITIVLETNDSEVVKEKEIELISFYGRKDLGLGTLCNLTDGGEGSLNVSEETREKLRKISVNRYKSFYTIYKISGDILEEKISYAELLRKYCIAGNTLISYVNNKTIFKKDYVIIKYGEDYKIEEFKKLHSNKKQNEFFTRNGRTKGIEIIKQLNNEGIKQSDIATKCKISKSTVCLVLRDKYKYI